MNNISRRLPNRASVIAEKIFSAFRNFFHIDAMAGVVLVIATFVALLLANSTYAAAYQEFWQQKISIEAFGFSFSKDLHFLVNDGFMTLFFLVAGMEIRREIHEGALSEFRLALLPIVAAIGGVIIPAIIYFSTNPMPPTSHGWAVPTATDIAFAIGILALLGKSVPTNLRIVLLALATIDDIIAILIIAIFYSGSFDLAGLPFACLAIIIIVFLQWIGINSALIYVLPVGLLWLGLMICGIHPSLSGVIAGLLTPALAPRSLIAPVNRMSYALEILKNENPQDSALKRRFALLEIGKSLAAIDAPVSRLVHAFNPWVSFLIMPLFALANAGINISDVDFENHFSFIIMIGIGLGLVIGKPLGIVLFSFIAVRFGLCRLPAGINWHGMALVGLLGGIGFTMSIFTATLAFSNAEQLEAAKLAILGGSLVSAVFGLAYGLSQKWRATHKPRKTL
ncbi:Na+/H+ antiporter NhaA [Bartonella choladocola]|uniref:Na+/H+ antiporter NhaA n=1 Tax=Bartonella choladocola TaxID=2750995 RepID=UPI003998D08A